jgi:hypothetical protein
MPAIFVSPGVAAPACPRNRPRAADDFTTIRARMEELRREREGAQAAESDLQRELPINRA